MSDSGLPLRPPSPVTRGAIPRVTPPPPRSSNRVRSPASYSRRRPNIPSPPREMGREYEPERGLPNAPSTSHDRRWTYSPSYGRDPREKSKGREMVYDTYVPGPHRDRERDVNNWNNRNRYPPDDYYSHSHGRRQWDRDDDRQERRYYGREQERRRSRSPPYRSEHDYNRPPRLSPPPSPRRRDHRDFPVPHRGSPRRTERVAGRNPSRWDRPTASPDARISPKPEPSLDVPIGDMSPGEVQEDTRADLDQPLHPNPRKSTYPPPRQNHIKVDSDASHSPYSRQVPYHTQNALKTRNHDPLLQKRSPRHSRSYSQLSSPRASDGDGNTSIAAEQLDTSEGAKPTEPPAAEGSSVSQNEIEMSTSHPKDESGETATQMTQQPTLKLFSVDDIPIAKPKESLTPDLDASITKAIGLQKDAVARRPKIVEELRQARYELTLASIDLVMAEDRRKITERQRINMEKGLAFEAFVALVREGKIDGMGVEQDHEQSENSKVVPAKPSEAMVRQDR